MIWGPAGNVITENGNRKWQWHEVLARPCVTDRVGNNKSEDAAGESILVPFRPDLAVWIVYADNNDILEEKENLAWEIYRDLACERDGGKKKKKICGY